MFKVGDRIELNPATDRWMKGDRYGEVVSTTKRGVHVRMDRSGRTLFISTNNYDLMEVIS